MEDIAGRDLSHREIQIVALVAEGESNKEIAFKLKLAEGSIKVYMSVIFRKTGIENRTKLAIWWLRKSDNSSQSE